MLSIDSTSGNEKAFAEFLTQYISARCRCNTEIFKSRMHPQSCNMLFSWGCPKVVFCTHLDTVPPYIPPTVDGSMVRGRGSCDAKGQIISMLMACLELERAGESGFGLLLLHGEETGSFGAKEFAANHPGGQCVIVGEPTENKMVLASKGTKAFAVTINGKSCHSGYPQQGVSAVNLFLDMMNQIAAIDFPLDSILGKTTWNIGKLISDNPQNVLSSLLCCRIYFRTTFASDEFVVKAISGLANGDSIQIDSLGGDAPMRYLTLPGFDTTTVAFGSDAPQLPNFKNKILCGPGSILKAHTAGEDVAIEELEKAIDNYTKMFYLLKTSNF